MWVFYFCFVSTWCSFKIGLLVMFYQVGIVWPCLRLLYTLHPLEAPLSDCSKPIQYYLVAVWVLRIVCWSGVGFC